MLKPGSQMGEGDEALEYYAKHTAQIEVSEQKKYMHTWDIGIFAKSIVATLVCTEECTDV